MSKRNKTKSRRRQWARLQGWRALVAVGAVLCLFASTVIYGWRASRATRSTAVAPLSGDLQPGSPSTEYIYGGGRLISTEQPVSTSLLPPTGLDATAASVSQVNLTWTVPAGAVDHYEVQRKQTLSGTFTTLGPNPTTNSFIDGGVAGNTSYLYQVRAVPLQGVPSGFSNIDLATTVIFTDDPLTAGGTVIKAQHVDELRVAVTAVRATAGLTPASWADPALTVGVMTVKAVHIDELRTGLNAALSALGFATPGYTDPSLAPGSAIVKKVHVEELRQRVK